MEDQFFLILIRVLCTVFAHLQELRHISVVGVLVKKKQQKPSFIHTHYSLTFSRLMTYMYIYIYIYIYRTAPLTSRCCILYIYLTNARTEYFKHAAHSPFFPLQNAVYFIMLPFLVPVLFTF